MDDRHERADRAWDSLTEGQRYLLFLGMYVYMDSTDPVSLAIIGFAMPEV